MHQDGRLVPGLCADAFGDPARHGLVMGSIHTLLLTVHVAKLVEQGENCTWIFVPLEEPSEINELWGRDVLGVDICSAPLSRQEVGRVTSSSAASVHRIEAVPAVLLSSDPTQEAACRCTGKSAGLQS